MNERIFTYVDGTEPDYESHNPARILAEAVRRHRHEGDLRTGDLFVTVPAVCKQVDLYYSWVRVVKVDILIDGAEYDLGATMGRYNAETDTFSLGNCFVPRSETIYVSWVRVIQPGKPWSPAIQFDTNLDDPREFYAILWGGEPWEM